MGNYAGLGKLQYVIDSIQLKYQQQKLASWCCLSGTGIHVDSILTILQFAECTVLFVFFFKRTLHFQTASAGVT